MSARHLKRATHTFGASTPFERVALDRIDLKMKKAEILGVIGPLQFPEREVYARKFST